MVYSLPDRPRGSRQSHIVKLHSLSPITAAETDTADSGTPGASHVSATYRQTLGTHNSTAGSTFHTRINTTFHIETTALPEQALKHPLRNQRTNHIQYLHFSSYNEIIKIFFPLFCFYVFIHLSYCPVFVEFITGKWMWQNMAFLKQIQHII